VRGQLSPRSRPPFDLLPVRRHQRGGLLAVRRNDLGDLRQRHAQPAQLPDQPRRRELRLPIAPVAVDTVDVVGHQQAELLVEPQCLR
jgi:hypothetical protein